MAYKVSLSDEVAQAIDDTYQYISHVLLSQQGAKNTVTKILSGLEELEMFPQAGFDADDRVGDKLNSKYPTRGKVIGQYVVLYFIVEESKTVFISHLFHSKSDYITLLQKEKKKSKSD